MLAGVMLRCVMEAYFIISRADQDEEVVTQVYCIVLYCIFSRADQDEEVTSHAGG